MNDYYSLFREYLINQKSNSVNTRDSYPVSYTHLDVYKRQAWYLLAGLLLAFVLAADLNVLQLGEESAQSLGLHLGRTRFLAILAAALLAGGAVSFAGLLGFVGLLVLTVRQFIKGKRR